MIRLEYSMSIPRCARVVSDLLMLQLIWLMELARSSDVFGTSLKQKVVLASLATLWHVCTKEAKEACSQLRAAKGPDHLARNTCLWTPSSGGTVLGTHIWGLARWNKCCCFQIALLLKLKAQKSYFLPPSFPPPPQELLLCFHHFV